MQIELNREILFSDVGPEFTATWRSLLRIFQDAAAVHSERIGHGIYALHERGIIWALGKLAVTVHRYPKYGEQISLQTWSRGAQGYRMLRDFYVKDTQSVIATGSSMWFYVNRVKSKIERVPAAIINGYGTEPRLAMAQGVEKWMPYYRVKSNWVYRLQTRSTDLDAAGHVNHGACVDYAMEATRSEFSNKKPIRSVLIQFDRQIEASIREVEVELVKEGEQIRFQIRAHASCVAKGELSM